MHWIKLKNGTFINLDEVQSVGTSPYIKDSLIVSFSDDERVGIQDADDVARLKATLDKLAQADADRTRGSDQ